MKDRRKTVDKILKSKTKICSHLNEIWIHVNSPKRLKDVHENEIK